MQPTKRRECVLRVLKPTIALPVQSVIMYPSACRPVHQSKSIYTCVTVGALSTIAPSSGRRGATELDCQNNINSSGAMQRLACDVLMTSRRAVCLYIVGRGGRGSSLPVISSTLQRSSVNNWSATGTLVGVHQAMTPF